MSVSASCERYRSMPVLCEDGLAVVRDARYVDKGGTEAGALACRLEHTVDLIMASSSERVRELEKLQERKVFRLPVS